ncbi:family 16 glycosylhydrolase [Vibrio maritimus]
MIKTVSLTIVMSMMLTSLSVNAKEANLTDQSVFDEVKGNLIWSDEFNYEGKPDPNKWSYDLGPWPHNREVQTYTDSIKNAEVANGKLHIRAMPDDTVPSHPYTSARLKSRYKGDFLYGRIEVKASLPNNLGPWSAIWMKGTEEVYGGWPKSGEIDIMEYAYNKYPKSIKGTIHTEAYNHMTGTQKGETYDVDDVTKFHEYALEWTPRSLKFFVDDELYQTINYTKAEQQNNWEAWPFDQKMYVLLNVAVGGWWGGEDIQIEDYSQMVVDYVRIWDMHIDKMDDDIAPDAPQELEYNKLEQEHHVISWRPSVDNFAIEKYEVYLDGKMVSDSNRVSTVLNCLKADTKYNVEIYAFDFAGNKSEAATLTFQAK